MRIREAKNMMGGPGGALRRRPFASPGLVVLLLVILAAGATVRGPSIVDAVRPVSATTATLVPIPGGPLSSLVVSASDEAFISNPALGEVDVVNLATAELETPIPVGPQPHGLDFSPDGKTLYVANTGSDYLSVVDVATRTQTSQIVVGDYPLTVATASTGAILVATTTAMGANGSPGADSGALLEVDPATLAVHTLQSASFLTGLAASGNRSSIGVANSSGSPQIYRAATDSLSTGPATGFFLQYAAMNADGSRLLVDPEWSEAETQIYDASMNLVATIPGIGMGLAVDPSGSTAYRVGNDSIDVIDLARNFVTATIALPDPVGLGPGNAAPGQLALSSDGTMLAAITENGVTLAPTSAAVPIPCAPSVAGSLPGTIFASLCESAFADIVGDDAGHVFTTNPGRSEVDVLDLPTATLEAPIPVGPGPRGIDLSPDGRTLYVADFGNNDVSVVDVATRRQTGVIVIPGPSTPNSLAVTDNGQLLVTTADSNMGGTGSLYVVTLATGSVSELEGYITDGTSLAVSGDRSKVAWVDWDDSLPIRIYDAASGLLMTGPSTGSDLYTVSLDASGSRLLVDPGSLLYNGLSSSPVDIPNPGQDVIFSEDGRTGFRVPGTGAGGLEVLDLDKASVGGTLPLPEPWGSAIPMATVLPGGQLVAAVTGSGISVATITPVTGITSSPSNPTNRPDPGFSFTSYDPNDPDVPPLTTCSLDGGAFLPCQSPVSYPKLPDGTHTFTVKATGEGLSGSTTYSWFIDTKPPVVTITNHQSDPTPNTDIGIAFTVTDPVYPVSSLSVSCSLDGIASPAPCTSPRSGGDLSMGRHTFSIEATNPAGNSATATVSWDVVPQGLILVPVPSPSPTPSPSPPPALASPPLLKLPASPKPGYWMVDSNGSVYAFGAATWQGNAAAGNGLTVGIAATPSGHGYWAVSAQGAVSALGDALFEGDDPALEPRETITSLSSMPDGRGYWLFSTFGRVFAYGSAPFLGDMSGTTLNGPVLGSVATPSGKGYYMVAADGGVFAFGDAAFLGSMGGAHLNQPIVGLAPASAGTGYWLVAADGGVFAFGAPFEGSAGSLRLHKPVIGMTAYGDGYLLVASDGGIFDYSSEAFAGSLGDTPLRAPIVAMASAEAA